MVNNNPDAKGVREDHKTAEETRELDTIQAPSCPDGFIYTVQPGDTLFFIAHRFGVTLDALIRANPQIRDPDQIFPGQMICIPTVLPTVPPPPATCPGGFFYTIRAGDTLFLLSERFGVSLHAIIAANPQITNPNLIFPGQVICIPPANTTPHPSIPFDCVLGLKRTTAVSRFASGMARIENYAPAGWELFVSIDQVPDPASFRPTFNRYVAWVVRGGVVRLGIPLIKVPLTSVNGGVWTGFFATAGGQIAPFDEVFITPEPTPSTRPTGPIILRGFSRDCC